MLVTSSRRRFQKAWADRHDVEELKGGGWFAPVKSLMGTTYHKKWTARHRAHAMAWVMRVEWTLDKHACYVLARGQHASDI